MLFGKQFDYYNKKQNKVVYVNTENMDVLPPSAPNLVFECDTYMAYRQARAC